MSQKASFFLKVFLSFFLFFWGGGVFFAGSVHFEVLFASFFGSVYLVVFPKAWRRVLPLGSLELFS